MRQFVVLLLGVMLLGPPLQQPSDPLALLEASPTPGSVVETLPDEVVLTFNQPVRPAESTLTLRDERGIILADLTVQQTAPLSAVLSAELPPLAEGIYTIVYAVESEDGALLDALRFEIDLPPPAMRLLQPNDGEVFAGEPVTVQVAVRNISPVDRSTMLRIWLEDAVIGEVRATTFELGPLEPGIYTLRVALVRDGVVLEPTSRTITLVSIEPTAAPTLTPDQAPQAEAVPAIPPVAAAVVAVILIAVGVVVGRWQPPNQ